MYLQLEKILQVYNKKYIIFFQVADLPYKIGHITNKMKNLKFFSTCQKKKIFLFSPHSIPNSFHEKNFLFQEWAIWSAKFLKKFSRGPNKKIFLFSPNLLILNPTMKLKNSYLLFPRSYFPLRTYIHTHKTFFINMISKS